MCSAVFLCVSAYTFPLSRCCLSAACEKRDHPDGSPAGPRPAHSLAGRRVSKSGREESVELMSNETKNSSADKYKFVRILCIAIYHNGSPLPPIPPSPGEGLGGGARPGLKVVKLGSTVKIPAPAPPPAPAPVSIGSSARRVFLKCEAEEEEEADDDDDTSDDAAVYGTGSGTV